MTIGLSHALLFGVAVGDALGVPVEFKSRKEMELNPIKDMREFGTHNQPIGTFSDDSSLTFCLAESLIDGFNLNDISSNIVKWESENYWTAHNYVFDIGNSTNRAISKLKGGVSPLLSGGAIISDNGNGSLMRILPLVLYTFDKPISERYEIAKLASSITHAHIYSVIACFYYLEFARQIISKENDKLKIYNSLKKEIPNFLKELQIDDSIISEFKYLFDYDIESLNKSQIKSSGYVIHTLEASIWCLLRTYDYKSAVLEAVNLGEDTDTTAAVTGGLAALLYGFDAIPTEWVNSIVRKDDIFDLAERVNEKYKLL